MSLPFYTLKTQPRYLCCGINLMTPSLAADWLHTYVCISVVLYRLTCYFRSNDDPDAWSLIGNLHLAKMEWGPAQVSTCVTIGGLIDRFIVKHRVTDRLIFLYIIFVKRWISYQYFVLALFDHTKNVCCIIQGIFYYFYICIKTV
jgi:hypothetical protein